MCIDLSILNIDPSISIPSNCRFRHTSIVDFDMNIRIRMININEISSKFSFTCLKNSAQIFSFFWKKNKWFYIIKHKSTFFIITYAVSWIIFLLKNIDFIRKMSIWLTAIGACPTGITTMKTIDSQIKWKKVSLPALTVVQTHAMSMTSIRTIRSEIELD